MLCFAVITDLALLAKDDTFSKCISIRVLHQLPLRLMRNLTDNILLVLYILFLILFLKVLHSCGRALKGVTRCHTIQKPQVVGQLWGPCVSVLGEGQTCFLLYFDIFLAVVLGISNCLCFTDIHILISCPHWLQLLWRLEEWPILIQPVSLELWLQPCSLPMQSSADQSQPGA